MKSFFFTIIFSFTLFAINFTAPSLYVENFGAEVIGGTATSFRVWGPECTNIYLTGTFNNWNPTNLPLALDTNFPSDFGGPYWSIAIDGVLTGEIYKFIIINDEGKKVTKLDPWAKNVDWAQGGSEVIDLGEDWTPFTRPNFNEMVLYELHPGTFGDGFNGIIEKIDYLKHLGVNVIQLMPSAEFGGELSWGYNPEGFFAPESSYGGFHGWKKMVNALHSNGIAVLNDVVYNHTSGGDFIWQWNGKYHEYPEGYVCGKCGQYIFEDGGMFYYSQYPEGSGDYYAPWNAWHTYWGHNRPNYSKPEVRWFIRNNVLYWLNNLHADGLRVDSTITIRHLHWDKQEYIPAGNSLLRWFNQDRAADAFMLAEDTQDDEYITTRPQNGEGDGCGFDSQWDNPFVHWCRWLAKTPNDADRDMYSVRDHITEVNNNRDIALIKYVSCHDENANGKSRLNVEIDYPAGTNYWAKKRVTMAAGIVMTAVGVPMMFQGDEILMDKWFSDEIPLDWSRLNTFGGINECYRGMIHCRRNLYGNTKGLTGSGCYFFHINDSAKVVAFTRYYNGGGADDVLVIINCSNTAFTDYDLDAGANSFLNWDWYLQYTSNRKCYDWQFGGSGIGEEAKTHVNDGHFYLGPYSVNIYGLGKLPAPTADFVVSETNGILPRIVRFYNRCTSLPRWYRWDITAPGGYTNTIQPNPNPAILITNPGPYDVKLFCYLQQDNTTQLSDSITKTQFLHFVQSGWINGAYIPGDVGPGFLGPLAFAVQDTETDWTGWDTLAAVRVYTNDNGKMHISVSGSAGQDSAIVVLLDTDSEMGSNVLPIRGGCTEVIRNMAGMTFDTNFSPDHAFVIKPDKGPSAKKAHLDYSSILDNANDYLGTISGFSSGASQFSNGAWEVGFYNAESAGNLSGSAAENFAFGLEVVAPYSAWDIFTTNLKVQVLLTSYSGRRSANQSLPGVAGNTSSNAASGLSKDKDYSKVSGNQFVQFGIDSGIEINHAPVWNHTSDQSFIAGSVADFFVSAVDLDGHSVSLSCSDASNFTDLGSGTGHYQWATGERDVGQYYLNFYAEDSTSLSTTQEVSLYISPQGLETNIIFDGMNITSDFSGAFTSLFQNTPPLENWGTNDYLAGLRVITNSQQFILGLSGVVKFNNGNGNNGLAVLFDTDPDAGTNVMPDLATTSFRAQNMAGMTLDTNFTPDYVLTIGLEQSQPAGTSWADFSKLVGGGNNDYLGELENPVINYGTLYSSDYMIGFKLEPIDTNLNLAPLADTGLEIAFRYSKLNVKTNFVKVQAVEIDNSGKYYSNQSLPPINNFLEYDGGECSEARFDLIPGDQHLMVSIPLITNFNYSPVLDYIGPKTVVAGEELFFTVTATDEGGTVPLLFAKDLPPGATFVTNGSSGAFAWQTILADLGDYYVTFRAFDGQMADSETVHIKVAEDKIDWCNLQWPYSISSSATMPPGDTIYGRVRVPGRTSATGEVSELSAQLGYGSAGDPPDNWTWVDAQFAYDKENDIDEYKTVFAAEDQTGTYYYAFRYKYTHQGSGWVYGTISGGPEDSVNISDAGVWTVLPLEDKITDAKLQWPYEIITAQGEWPQLIYGRVYIPGKTNSNAPAEDLDVHVGYGANFDSFAWVQADFNTNYGTYNEFQCQLNPISELGSYYYAYRFTYHLTNIIYGLTDGMYETYENSKAGEWTVVVPEPTIFWILDFGFWIWCITKRLYFSEEQS